jgi:hypothetical protein
MDKGLLLFLIWLVVSAGQSPPIDAMTVSVRGTIERFDPATRTLWLSTAHGTVQLPVPPSTRIRQGWRKVDASELRKLIGDRATVRYTDSAGRKSVESVHVFGK